MLVCITLQWLFAELFVLVQIRHMFTTKKKNIHFIQLCMYSQICLITTLSRSLRVLARQIISMINKHLQIGLSWSFMYNISSRWTTYWSSHGWIFRKILGMRNFLKFLQRKSYHINSNWITITKWTNSNWLPLPNSTNVFYYTRYKPEEKRIIF